MKSVGPQKVGAPKKFFSGASPPTYNLLPTPLHCTHSTVASVQSNASVVRIRKLCSY